MNNQENFHCYSNLKNHPNSSSEHQHYHMLVVLLNLHQLQFGVKQLLIEYSYSVSKRVCSNYLDRVKLGRQPLEKLSVATCNQVHCSLLTFAVFSMVEQIFQMIGNHQKANYSLLRRLLSMSDYQHSSKAARRLLLFPSSSCSSFPSVQLAAAHDFHQKALSTEPFSILNLSTFAILH